MLAYDSDNNTVTRFDFIKNSSEFWEIKKRFDSLNQRISQQNRKHRT